MASKQEEEEDSLIIGDMQLNDSFIAGKPEPRLLIRLPGEINKNASVIRSPGIITSEAHIKSISSSPEIQYLNTVRNETQRQNSLSSQRSDADVNFRGFQTRYSKRKLIKSSLHTTSNGMMAYLEMNRDVMLCAWERKLKSTRVSGSTNSEMVHDGSWSPGGSVSSESEFNERINPSHTSLTRENLYHLSKNSSMRNSPQSCSSVNERLRHPSHNSSVGIRSPTLYSPSDHFKNSLPSQSTLISPNSQQEDPRLKSKNQDRIQINNSSPSFWNPEAPQTLNSPTSESGLRNPDPPQSSFRQLSPPYDPRSHSRNPDSPPHNARAQPTYENRLCLTNPDPPSLKLQSLEKNPFWEERRISNFENSESLRHEIQNNHSINNINSVDFVDNDKEKRYSTQQSIHKNNLRQTDRNVEQGNLYNNELDETINMDIEVDKTIDMDIARRCPVYMSKALKCHKGDYCEKIHRFPREDGVVCRYMKNEGCRRPASDCWFWHPGENVNKFVPDVDAPPLVQPMGALVGYIRKQLTKNPDKYKFSEKMECKSSEKAEFVFPSAVGNANDTPLGPRQIIGLDSNYSPLLPQQKTSNSTNNVDNSNIQEHSSPSKSDMSPSSNHISTNSAEKSSIEVSRIKRSRPVKVGAPRKKIMEDININNDEISDSIASLKVKSFKIPKKASVNASNTSLINNKTSKIMKTVENTEASNKSKNQSLHNTIASNENKEITSNDTANGNLMKTNVNDKKMIKSSRSRKENQSSNKYSEEKNEKSSKKSKEGNAHMKRKVRPISENEEDENMAEKSTKVLKKLSSNGSSIDREEKIKEKKSNKPPKKASKVKRSRIESSDESEEEAIQENITKNKKSKSSSLENTKKAKLKKSSKESEEERDEENPQPLVTKNKKLKIVNNSEDIQDIQVKKSKNQTRKNNKHRQLRIESSNESEEEEVVPQTVVTKDKSLKSNMDVDKQVSEQIKDNTTNTNVKVEVCSSSNSNSTKVIEEITLSDSDDECDLVKSETFLKEEEEVNEVDSLGEFKAMDDLKWAINKVFDILEQVTEGQWKRTPNQIEQDLYSVLQQFNLEKFEDSSYPHIYNMDVNYRQLYINILSEVDVSVQEHAILCKLKYPNCKNIPDDHDEDMSCCK